MDTVGIESPENHAETTTALAVMPSAALAIDLKRAGEYRQHTKASETRRGYKGDWKRFQTWAAATGVETLPAAPEVISAHLSWLASGGYSVASMERFLSAGSHYHRAARCDFPRNAYVVSETLKGIRRTVGVKRSKKAPLGLRALAGACERLRREAEGLPVVEQLGSLRNQAMLTVGWFCLLRSANLVAIRREDVRLVRSEDDDWIDDDDSPNGLILHLPGSKTDQLKEGRDIAVYAQADETVCPVHALVAYLRAGRFAPGDLIFSVNARTVSRLLKRLVSNPVHGHESLRSIEDCEACAAAARRFASHSLRRGAATLLAKRGTPEREIMRQGGWKNERVARGYIEHATLFENNPTKNLASKEPTLKKEEEEMGTAAHERAIENHFDEILRKDPEVAGQMAILRNKILDGFYQQWLVDAFFQNWNGKKPSLAETYAFGQLYSSYVHGEIGVFHVPVKSGPFPDANTVSNQAVLDELPDHPLFEAKFFGGPGDYDGWFLWRGEIEITRMFPEDGGALREEPWVCTPSVRTY